jgi:hypothetical protein
MQKHEREVPQREPFMPKHEREVPKREPFMPKHERVFLEMAPFYPCFNKKVSRNSYSASTGSLAEASR